MDAASGGAGTGALGRDAMADTAGVRRTRSRPAATPIIPDEVLVWEILIRLPVKTLLRCRAVCVSWRNLISAPTFIIDHHKRQPSLPLTVLRGKVKSERFRHDVAIDAFDIRRSPAERRPVFRFEDFHAGQYFVIHGSCDGLILLSVSNGRFNICNPATRQWAPVSALTGAFANIAGLYPHRSSGEYRVLYWIGSFKDRRGPYYVLTVGSSDGPRCISCPLAAINLDHNRLMCPPVLLHNCLHWDPSSCFQNNRVVVFDTVVESFRSMSSPTAAKDARLLEMDSTLSISCLDDIEGRMKVWVLQDYKEEVWSLRYQIELPTVEVSRFGAQPRYMVLSQEGDMLVWCHLGEYLLHCDNKGKLLQELGCGKSWALHATGQWFKESLVRHTFFPRKGGGRSKQPRFFQGL